MAIIDLCHQFDVIFQAFEYELGIISTSTTTYSLFQTLYADV